VAGIGSVSCPVVAAFGTSGIDSLVLLIEFIWFVTDTTILGPIPSVWKCSWVLLDKITKFAQHICR
jgi:hypothetical protein